MHHRNDNANSYHLGEKSPEQMSIETSALRDYQAAVANHGARSLEARRAWKRWSTVKTFCSY